MNTKIFALITENLQQAFSLPKYADIKIDRDTQIDALPWTPARFAKFKQKIQQTLDLESEFSGTVEETVNDFDKKYLNRFFGEIWKPKTEKYGYTGWGIVDEVMKYHPKKVLDVGCGYNQFKGRIPNLIGIDPYNNCADYMVDILEYNVGLGTYDAIIALGSINFNSQEDIEARVEQCVKLMAPKARMYVRANPGIQWPNGPWVDIFAWSFEKAHEIAVKFDLELEAFKKDQDRLYWVYIKR
jgi:hypothetical protein